MKVVVCDDDPNRVNDWSERIALVLGSRVDVTPLFPADFAQAVGALKDRRVAGSWDYDAASVFDSADVLVLDSDLTPDPDAKYSEKDEQLVHRHLNSEMGGEVAHLARGFTSTGAIVVVNEGEHQRTFDLTLVSRLRGVADCYVSEADVANPRLWGGGDTGAEAFRPWAWPLLTAVPAAIDFGVENLELDSPALGALGLDDQDLSEKLLIGQLESLGVGTPEEAATLTMGELAHNRYFGLRRKELTTSEGELRVAVCALRRWVERVLLPSQNVLIDLPHLAQHNPWLVPGREDEAVWRSLETAFWSSDPPIAVSAFNSTASQLLGRNVWNIAGVGSRPAGARVLSSDPVFCEDISSFRPVGDVSDFVSDVEGPFARRFVAEVDDVAYNPRNRLAR